MHGALYCHLPKPAAVDAAAAHGGGAWAEGAPVADQEHQALPAGKSWFVVIDRRVVGVYVAGLECFSAYMSS